MTRRPPSPPPSPLGDSVVWHDLECGRYAADLPLWRELAAGNGTAVLELGCGTGRVALDLAANGADIVALDSDPALVSALAPRASERGLHVRTEVSDARSFDLGRRFDLVIACMQMVQLLGGVDGRRAMLACVRRHLAAGARFAAALASPGVTAAGSPAEIKTGLADVLPDIHERDGWVFSIVPLAVRAAPGGVELERRLEAVSPGGELWREHASVRLDRLAPEELEAEAASLGFRPAGVRRVPPTDSHVGSDVVMLDAA